ncbi:hypothetical protein NLG97_g2775 [Lecanicillium saksenae]|uniref:Uncharacterized protein n=1 Tax=Lecanicillium saksenae TaxID=468837 RepID=A0ACC1R021_9HYPO|nr:hypothetical protein NLG97_g2775 [Lecanicillium saksenae]
MGSASSATIATIATRIPSSTFATLAHEATLTASPHTAAADAKHDHVHGVDKGWLGKNYRYSVKEVSKRNENLLRSTRLGIGFGAAAFAILLIAAVYLGIRCCRKKPSDEEDNFSMEISGVQYEMREEYGPKPISRCSTCDTDARRAEGSMRADSGISWSDIPRAQDIIDGERKRDTAGEGRGI